jgi:hypothetical protein
MAPCGRRHCASGHDFELAREQERERNSNRALIFLVVMLAVLAVVLLRTRPAGSRAAQAAEAEAQQGERERADGGGSGSGSAAEPGFRSALARVAGALGRPLGLGDAAEAQGCFGGRPENFRHDPATPIRAGAIFISIASYRDDECKDTVIDLFDKATHPERVFIGVVQQNKEAEEDCFDRCEKCSERKRSGHIRVINFDYLQARGPCFARYQASKLWRGEEVYMQIDSHTQFQEHWDETVFRELARTGDPNAVLSAYPPTEEQMRDFNANGFSQMIMNCNPIINGDGIASFEAAVVNSPPGPLAQREPVPVAFSGAGLVVMPGRALFDVPFDPNLSFLFFGEELLFSARLWTAGYNFYAPVQTFLVHSYGREGKPRFWNDLKNFETCRKKAVMRAKYLLGAARLDEVDPAYQKDLDVYGMGRKRTLEEYREYAGFDLATKKVENRCSATGYKRLT